MTYSRTFYNDNALHINGPFQILQVSIGNAGDGYVPARGEFVYFVGSEDGDDLILGDGVKTLGQLHQTGGIFKRLSQLEARCTALESREAPTGINGGELEKS